MRFTRTRALTAVLALGLSAGSLVPASAASAADDVVEWAITDGTPVKIATTSGDQKAYVFFNGFVGRHLTVACDPGTGALTFVIQRPDGSQLPKRRCTGKNSLVVNPLHESGRFRMLFTGENGQPFGTTVKVRMVEDVTGTIMLDGAPLTLEAAAPEQNYSFALALKARQRVQLMCRTNATYGNIFMIDPSGTITGVDIHSSDWCRGLMDEAGLYTATEAGTYRFVIRSSSPDSRYTATMSAISTLPDATAQLATDGTPVTLGVTAPYQRVRATFTLEADSRVYITCERQGDQYQYTPVELFTPGPAGSRPLLRACQRNGPGEEPTVFNDMVRAGTSTILIDPVDEETNEFILRVYTVPAPVTAEVTLDGTPVTLETTTLGQHAQFAVTAGGGERIWVGCRLGPRRAPKPMTGVRADVELTQPDGRSLAQGFCHAPEEVEDPSALSFSTARLTKAGTHTLTVRLNTAETNTVTLWAYKVPADVEAIAAVGGVPVTVETTVPGQRAHVRFPGVAGVQYSVSCDVIGNPGRGYIRLTSPSGASIGSSKDCRPNQVLVTGPVTESGDFLIDFAFDKAGTGRADVKVTSAG